MGPEKTMETRPGSAVSGAAYQDMSVGERAKAHGGRLFLFAGSAKSALFKVQL